MGREKEFDVFISYRQHNQPIYAKLVYAWLIKDGYRVFLDREGLGSGAFDEKLFEVIEGVQDLVLILPTGALDRCVEPGDWIRKEVVHAMEHRKNIIPLCIDFSFPDVLPADMEKLRDYNCIQFNDEYFVSSLDKVESFLYSQPHSPEPTKEESDPVKAELVIPETRSEEEEDDEPLEPVMEIHPVHPAHRRYSQEEIRRARAELKESLTAEWKQLNELSIEKEIGSKSAYRGVRRSMRLIKELMGAYTFLKYDEEMARNKFERVFEPAVTKFRVYAERGHRNLNENMTNLLRQYTYGLRNVIRSLDS